MKRIYVLAAFLLTATLVQAQTAHKTTITWQDPGNADIYRSPTSCATAAAFTKIATAVPSGYVDSAVVGGQTSCYYIIEQPSNIPSNLMEVDTPSDGVVLLKTAKQTAGAIAQ